MYSECGVSKTPDAQLRERTELLLTAIDRANSIASTINDKLFSENKNVKSFEEACPPACIQDMTERALYGINDLNRKLDEINSKL